MDLSIIIVNWNTGKLLYQCLNSIFNSETRYSYEVFVVDNASTDESIQLASGNFSEVNFIINSNNIGFAAANNQAIKKATGEFILLLNPDTIIPKDNIEKAISYLKNNDNSNVEILGCRLYHANGELQRSIQTFPTLTKAFLVAAQLNFILHNSFLSITVGKKLAKFFPNNLGTINWEKYNTDCNVDSVLGAYFLTKKALFNELGLFDENFFIFGEEMDLAFRAKKARRLVRFYSGTSIIHYSSRSINQIKNEMYLELMRSHIYFCKKHRSKEYLIFYKICWLSGFLLNTILHPRFIFSKVEFSLYPRTNFLQMFFKIIFNPILNKHSIETA